MEIVATCIRDVFYFLNALSDCKDIVLENNVEGQIRTLWLSWDIDFEIIVVKNQKFPPV